MNNAFVSWLNDVRANQYVARNGEAVYRIIKVRANDDFDYLYYQGPA